jgi:peptidyl-prolyl cis-trans isomerase C
MNKPHKLTLPLLALSSGLLLSSVALSADDKKAEAAPAAAPAAVKTAPAAPAAPAAPQAAFTIPDPVAVVNGKAISKAAFEQYAQQLRGKAKVDSPDASKSLVDQLVMEELLVQQGHQAEAGR